MIDNSDNWIKLHRKMLEWEWYTDANTKCVFLHLLLKANFSDNEWRGLTISRGQVVTSIAILASELGISVMQIRIALNKLKATGEITIQPTNKFSIITIYNYDTYQYCGNLQQQAEQQATEQAGNKQITNQQHKNEKNEKKYKNLKEKENCIKEKKTKNERVCPDTRYGAFLKWLDGNCTNVQKVDKQITEEQLARLLEEYSSTEVSNAILDLENWKEFPKKRHSVYLSVRKELEKRKDGHIKQQ